MTTTDITYGHLYDADTHDLIREATREERETSDAEAARDGIIAVDCRVDGGWNGEDYRRCYVSE